MKLNIRELAVKPTYNGETVTIDLTKQFIDLLYDSATSWAGHKLVHKVDEGNGEFEVDAAEVAIIKSAMDAKQWKWIFQQPILEQLGEKFD